MFISNNSYTLVFTFMKKMSNKLKKPIIQIEGKAQKKSHIKRLVFSGLKKKVKIFSLTFWLLTANYKGGGMYTHKKRNGIG